MARDTKIAKTKTSNNPEPVVAKNEDGGVQITFIIPFAEISKTEKEVALELAKNIEIPGFRKGKAPLEKVLASVAREKLIERTLSRILPPLLGKVIDKHNLKLVMYPKYELISSKEGEDWQVRAITAEIPEFDLGDYQKAVKGSLSAKTIWTPGKGDDKKEKEKTREEKEQEVIKALLDNVKVKVPQVLIDEEVNIRLARLLERIEKLGLNLESYLASVGKNPTIIREEYTEQAKATIALDIILNKIADKESIEIPETEIDQAVSAGGADPHLASKLDTPEQRNMIKSILKKRAALETLTSLA